MALIFGPMIISRRTIFLISLTLAAVAVRLYYFAEYRGLPEFLNPTVDALFHHLSATAIAGGALTATEPFFRAPFYNYFLGLIYFVAGNSIAIARLMQLLIGSFTPLLVYLLARRLTDERGAIVAAILTLLCGDLVYFEGELLLEFLLVTQILLAWLCFLRFVRTQSSTWLALAGLIVGVAVVTRPNAAVLAVVLIYLLVVHVRRNRSAALGNVVRMLAPMAVPIALVLAHNLTREDPAFTIATQGGINFYIGNNSAADGVSAVMPGKLGYNWQYEDIKYLAQEQEGHKLTPSQLSSFYYRKGIQEIASKPTHWLSLMIRKTVLFFSRFEISNNRNLIAFKSQFLALKLLPVGMWLLAPLGLCGMVLSWRRSTELRALAIFTMGYALTFVLFFVNSRFRLPLLPLLAIFSGYLTTRFLDLISEKRIKGIFITAAGCVVLFILLNTNVYRLRFDNQQQAALGRGNLDLRLGDNLAAVNSFRMSAFGQPPLKQAYLNLGVAYLTAGQPDSARKYFELENTTFGTSAEAFTNLSYLARQQGDPDKAIDYAREALREKPYLEQARLNLWYAWRELGFSDSVYLAVASLAKESELSLQEKFLLGVTALDLGIQRAAISTLREILVDQEEVEQPSYAEPSMNAEPFAITTDDDFRAKVLYNLGTAYGVDNQLDSAVQYLSEAIAADSNLTQAWMNLGSAFVRLARYRPAVEALGQAEQLGADSEVLYFNLALAKLGLADTTGALSDLQHCLEIKPDLQQAQALVAQLQKKSRR